MSILTQALSRFWQKGLAGCLPNSCLLCGIDSEDILCPGCLADLPPLPPAACPQCGEPTARGERCGHCLARPPHFDRTLALHRYAFPLDRLVHALKYGHQLPVAHWFGERLAEALAGDKVDMVIPMPLHGDRLRERGFNQAVEIARPLRQRLGLRLELDKLQRRRATAPQAELPLEERTGNVRGAFECRSDLKGLRILLVDDVMTSGATLDEAARTLKLHGAAEVVAAVVGRALRD